MSTTPAGILAYGFVQDSDKYGDPTEEWATAKQLISDDWQRFNALEKELGVTLKYLGHYDYHSVAIILKEPQYNAEWSDIEAINPAELARIEGTDARDRLRKFAEALVIDLGDREPEWILGCTYG